MIASAPVVLVHGVGSSFAHTWRKPGWVDILEADGRTVRPFDLPGHGTAADLDPGVGISGAASALLTAIDGAGPVDAVGMSAGGVTVMAASAIRPDLFRRIAVLAVGDAVLDAEPGTGAGDLAEALAGETEPEDVTHRLFWRMAESAGNDRRKVADFIRQAAPHADRAALAQVTCPVLVVIGDRDFGGPAIGLAAALPQARLVELPDLDHVGTATSVRAMDVVSAFLADA